MDGSQRKQAALLLRHFAVVRDPKIERSLGIQEHDAPLLLSPCFVLRIGREPSGRHEYSDVILTGLDLGNHLAGRQPIRVPARGVVSSVGGPLAALRYTRTRDAAIQQTDETKGAVRVPVAVKRGVHAGAIRISGRAPGALVFELPLGRFRSGDRCATLRA